MFMGQSKVRIMEGSNLGSGRKTVSGINTPTQLTSTDTPCNCIYISADHTIGQPVVVGDSSVNSGAGNWRGVVLFPGNDPILLYVDNLRDVWIASDSASATVCFTYFTA